uniref:mitogen-activated protein kinase kinase kinase n=1 Tax=Elaeis guineensis var. tenera TaxID=51953 RepID=A0A6J0PBZ8_ELAGV|nr:mitogen-activated protein kinase kinase kinase 5 isoform X2 [Elaeis guineensis]
MSSLTLQVRATKNCDGFTNQNSISSTVSKSMLLLHWLLEIRLEILDFFYFMIFDGNTNSSCCILQDRLRICIVVTKVALQFRRGVKVHSENVVPDEVKATGFQICAAELGSIVEGHDVKKLKVHAGVDGIADKPSTSSTNGLTPTEDALKCRQEVYGVNRFTESNGRRAMEEGQWQKGKFIGSGTFGNVYEAINRHTGALCAMKEVNIIPDDSKSAESLKQLKQIEDRFCIYLEYVHPGSINKYVHQHGAAMTESVVRNFTHHILKGLAYLHSKNIMHRDIKGANLLVDVNGVVKLADFGMARHWSEATAVLSLKGTPYWMAPEVVQATMNKDIGYNLSVDIWSLGCTIIEMCTGEHPWSGFEGAAAMFMVLHKDLPIPETLSSEGKDFLQLCFRRNPAERPTANQLLEHPFIRNLHHDNAHGSIQVFA